MDTLEDQIKRIREAIRLQGQTQTDMELNLLALSARLGDNPAAPDESEGGGADA